MNKTNISVIHQQASVGAKSHALYDGVVCLTWCLAFLVFSKGLLNVRHTITRKL